MPRVKLTPISTTMARNRSKSSWVQAHRRDPFVKRARRDGYRSRAAYKLVEIDRRDRLFWPGGIVLDLGAAPGGWAQVAAGAVGPSGRVIAVDILPMKPIRGVEFIRGDFREASVLQAVHRRLDGTQATLVMSDMAPNITGIREVDQPRAIYLAELALELARSVAAPGAMLLVKVFQGEGLEDFRRDVERSFRKVCTRKPGASRSQSRELYLLAEKFSV